MVMVVASGIAATASLTAFAEEKKLDIRQADTMGDVLGRMTGSPVDLTLRSGASLSGKLAKVHQNIAVLSELRGKEFYDAVVRIDDISAVTVRMRDR